MYTIKVNTEVFIGDLCYALAKDIYDGVWGAADYVEGEYTDPKTGLSFAVVDTKNGDGLYYGTDGNLFSVDAGVIGLCPIELATEYPRDILDSLGAIVKCHEASIDADSDGNITVWCDNDNQIDIFTGDEELDFEDEEEYWKDDWEEEGADTDSEDFEEGLEEGVIGNLRKRIAKQFKHISDSEIDTIIKMVLDSNINAAADKDALDKELKDIKSGKLIVD